MTVALSGLGPGNTALVYTNSTGSTQKLMLGNNGFYNLFWSTSILVYPGIPDYPTGGLMIPPRGYHVLYDLPAGESIYATTTLAATTTIMCVLVIE